MTDTNPNLPPAGKPAEEWTKAEQDAFWKDQNERAKRVHEKAMAALAPFREVMGEMMSYRQQLRLEGVIVKAVEVADYFGNEDLDITVEVSRQTKGRKHSPWSTWWVSFKVARKGAKALVGSSQGFCSIGKHGAVDGTLFDNSIGGRTIKLGR